MHEIATSRDGPVGLGPGGSAALLVLASLTIMVGRVLVPSLPAIAAGLGVGDAGSWLITLPSLGAVLFALATGALIDRIGARRAVLGGCLLHGLLGLAGAGCTACRSCSRTASCSAPSRWW